MLSLVVPSKETKYRPLLSQIVSLLNPKPITNAAFIYLLHCSPADVVGV